MLQRTAIWKKLVAPTIRPWADRLIASTSWTIAGSVSGQFFGLLGALLAARILGGEEFGQLSAVRGLVMTFGLFSGAGLGVVAVRYLAEVRENDLAALSQRIGLLQRVSLRMAGVVTLLAVLFAPFIADKWLEEKSLVMALWLGCPLVMLNGLSAIQNGMLGGLEKFNLVARGAVIESAGNFLGVFFGALYFDVAGAIGGASLAGVVAFVYRKHLLRKEFAALGIKPTVPTQVDRPWLLHEVLPYMLVGLIPQPFEWYARIQLIHSENGFVELGIFTVAFNCAQVLIFLPRQFAAPSISLLANMMSGEDQVLAVNLARLKLRVTLLLAALVAMPVIAFADYIPRLFGYHDGGDVVVVLALANLLTTCAIVFRSVLYSVGKMWMQCVHVVVWAVVLILCWIIFQDLGALGLACAYLGAFGVHIIFQGMDAARVLIRR